MCVSVFPCFRLCQLDALRHVLPPSGVCVLACFRLCQLDALRHVLPPSGVCVLACFRLCQLDALRQRLSTETRDKYENENKVIKLSEELEKKVHNNTLL